MRSVPDCVALSVTLLDEDLTFTLVDREATSEPPHDDEAGDTAARPGPARHRARPTPSTSTTGPTWPASGRSG